MQHFLRLFLNVNFPMEWLKLLKWVWFLKYLISLAYRLNKTAAIWNESDFLALEARSAEIFTAIQTASENYAGRTKNTRSAAQDLLLSVIVGSISVKAHIVTIDERETGLRNLVNFGHSIGHAIEAILTPTILHGECISVGMILEAELSRQMGILSQVGVGRLSRCLKAYNLPIALSDPRIANIPAACLLTVDHLLDIMRIDKKNSGPNKKIVILSRIGATYEPKATVVKDELIAKTLSEAAKVIPGVPSHNPVVMSTPGSKSISNRALVLAALGKGTCRLTNLLHSDDTQVMMSALKELKVSVELIVKVLILTLQGRVLNFHGKTMVIPWLSRVAKVSSPYLPGVKNSILAMQELLLASLPLFAPSSRLRLRMILVLLSSLAMLA